MKYPTAAAFSPDGALLAVAGAKHVDMKDGRLHRRSAEILLLDPKKKRVLRRMDCSEGVPYALAFSPDGLSLAVYVDELWLIVWDLKSDRLRPKKRRLPPNELDNPQDTEFMVFSKDSKLLFINSFHGPFLWNLNADTARALPLKKHVSYHALALAPDGRTFAAATSKIIRAWNLETGQLVCQFPPPRAKIICLAFSPDSKTLAGGTLYHGGIELWDITTGTSKARFWDGSGHVGRLQFSQDGGRLIAMGSQGIGAKVWDVAKGQLLTSLPSLDRGGGSSGLSGLWALTSDGRAVVAHGPNPSGNRSGNRSGNPPQVLQLWDLEPQRQALALLQIQALPIPDEGGGDVKLSAAGITLVRNREQIECWDLRTVKAKRLPSLPAANIHSLAVAPDGNTLAAVERINSKGPSGYAIKLWQRDGEQKPLTVAVFEAEPSLLGFSGDGSMLAAIQRRVGGKNISESFHLWACATGKEIHSSPLPPAMQAALAMSPEGQTLVGQGPSQQTLSLWKSGATEVASLALFEGPPAKYPPSATTARFSGDGQMLAVAFDNGVVQLWDILKLQRTGTIRAHVGEVTCLDFSPDGQTLASGGMDRLVKLWNVPSAQERAILRGHDSRVIRVAFIQGGRRLVSVTVAGGLKVWE